MYCPSARTPRCRHRPSQCPPAPTVPMTSPATTTAPSATAASTGSTLDTRPSACAMLTTPRSTTRPTNDTVPPVTATTGAPATAARSMPRCPAAKRCAGARHGSTTSNPATGDDHSADSGDDGEPGAGTAEAAGRVGGGGAASSASARNTPGRSSEEVHIAPPWRSGGSTGRPAARPGEKLREPVRWRTLPDHPRAQPVEADSQAGVTSLRVNPGRGATSAADRQQERRRS